MGQDGENVAPTRTRPSTRPARCGRGRKAEITRRAIPASSTSTSATTSSRRWRGRTTASRAARNTRSCSTSRRARPSTCGTASIAAASSSTCAACSSWTMPSSCCRPTCASCAASSIPTTCRSTSRARSCSRAATSRRSAPAASSACWACSRTWRENEPEKYATFWKEFGRVLKEGIGEDSANRERIAKLLRFSSTHDDSEEQNGLARRLRRRA